MMEEIDAPNGDGMQRRAEARLPARRRISAAGIVWGGVLGFAATAAVVLVYWMVTARGTIPPLTEAAYEAALEHWKHAGPADYNQDLVLSGSQTGNIHV